MTLFWKDKPLCKLSLDELYQARAVAVSEAVFDYRLQSRLRTIDKEIEDRERPFEAHRRLYI